jgi:hypothetical protein
LAASAAPASLTLRRGIPAPNGGGKGHMGGVIMQELHDVVVGDVFLVSGQSNIDIPQTYGHQIYTPRTLPGCQPQNDSNRGCSSFNTTAQMSSEAFADELGRSQGLLRLMIVGALRRAAANTGLCALSSADHALRGVWLRFHALGARQRVEHSWVLGDCLFHRTGAATDASRSHRADRSCAQQHGGHADPVVVESSCVGALQHHCASADSFLETVLVFILDHDPAIPRPVLCSLDLVARRGKRWPRSCNPIQLGNGPYWTTELRLSATCDVA